MAGSIDHHQHVVALLEEIFKAYEHEVEKVLKLRLAYIREFYEWGASEIAVRIQFDGDLASRVCRALNETPDAIKSEYFP